MNKGFTLVELMIVVSVVGILALLAIYGVRHYIEYSRTTEARNSVGQIAKDACAAYQRDGGTSTILPMGAAVGVASSLCADASASVPKNISSVKASKYQSSPADWNADAATNSGFACLQFHMEQPQYYMYSYSLVSGGGNNGNNKGVGNSQGGGNGGPKGGGTTGFLATANGDLDGDGITSAFSITGSIQGAFLTTSPTISESNPTE